MFWILLVVGCLGAVIFFGMSVIEIFSCYRDWCDIRRWLIKMFICIVLGAVGFFGLCGIEYFSYDEVSQTEDWELVSLTDNSQISGKGSGGLFYVRVSIVEKDVYSFYYKLNDNGIKRGKVDADKTTIYEKDDCTPHIVQQKTYTRNKLNIVVRGILAFGYGESTKDTYEIYIPKGSIYSDFSLDAQ